MGDLCAFALALETAVQAVVDVLSGLYGSSFSLKRLFGNSPKLFHLGNTSAFLCGQETLRHAPLLKNLLIRILKPLLILLCNEFRQRGRIADDASNIWIVGQLLNTLLGNLELNAVGSFLDQCLGGFNLRLPPVLVLLGRSLLADRAIALLRLGSEELLRSHLFFPNPKTLFTRSGKLLGRFGKQSGSFQIQLLNRTLFRSF